MGVVHRDRREAAVLRVDVTVAGTDTVIADNVSYAGTSDYMTVPAGEYTLEVREATADNNGSVVTTVDVSLENGSAYTAYAVGYLNAENASAENASGPSFQVGLQRRGQSSRLPSRVRGDRTPVRATSWSHSSGVRHHQPPTRIRQTAMR